MSRSRSIFIPLAVFFLAIVPSAYADLCYGIPDPLSPINPSVLCGTVYMLNAGHPTSGILATHQMIIDFCQADLPYYSCKTLATVYRSDTGTWDQFALNNAFGGSDETYHPYDVYVHSVGSYYWGSTVVPVTRLYMNSHGGFPAQWDPKLGIHVT